MAHRHETYRQPTGRINERIAKILVQVLIEHQFTTLEASLLHVSQSIALLTMM
jgi:hypothetical protein